MGAIDFQSLSQPHSPDSRDLLDLLHPVRTTAQLADVDDPINTTNKHAGRCVFDSTKGQPVWADAGLPASTWSLSTGVVASSPI
jgi:hypothetical protein